jgi:hypothetical protein
MVKPMNKKPTGGRELFDARTPWDKTFLTALSGGSDLGIEDAKEAVERVQNALVQHGMGIWRGGLFFLTDGFWKAFNHARSYVAHCRVPLEYDFLIVPSITVATQLLTPEDGNAFDVALAANYIAYAVFRQLEPAERRKLAKMNLKRMLER